MTNKEAIIKSMGMIDVDGNEIFPIAFPELLINMALLIAADCDMLLSMDFPTLEISGNSITGKAKEQSTFIDIAQVMNGNDMLRHTNLFRQLNGFIKWFLEQEVVETDDEMWYGSDVLFKAWNEYAVR